MHTGDRGMVFKPCTWAAEDPQKGPAIVMSMSEETVKKVGACNSSCLLSGWITNSDTYPLSFQTDLMLQGFNGSWWERSNRAKEKKTWSNKLREEAMNDHDWKELKMNCAFMGVLRDEHQCWQPPKTVVHLYYIWKPNLWIRLRYIQTVIFQSVTMTF